MGSGASAQDNQVSIPGPETSLKPPQQPTKSSSSISKLSNGSSLPNAKPFKQFSQTSSIYSGSRPLSRISHFSTVSAYGPQEVKITKTGFSVQHLTVNEGQVVTFVWHELTGNGFNVTQVVHDGEQFRPVLGGYNSGPACLKGEFNQLFTVEGEYKFVSAGIRCTPLTITVKPRAETIIEVTDMGFDPCRISVDEGTVVRFNWKCEIAHSVWEVKYCTKHSGFVKDEKEVAALVSTHSGTQCHELRYPGLYYYQTEGYTIGESNLCIVHVKAIQKEHRIEILDRTFNPMILLVEAGDRVWWHWDRVKCRKLHGIYQVEAPDIDHPPDDPYKITYNGFKWPSPSKSGMLCHTFTKPGVYFYSDQNVQEAAEYVGTIIVRPRQKERYIELSPDGFTPDLTFADAGDRIWWTWDMSDMIHSFAVVESERCLSSTAKTNKDLDCKDMCRYLDAEATQQSSMLGMSTVQLNGIGVYHFGVSDCPSTMSTSTVIVQPGSRNYTIHVTDSGFEPKILTVHPSDRVWWVWQQSEKQHNIVQVSHQGQFIKSGFCSGAPRDSPSAFVHQFSACGVYYYISQSLSKIFGAIVVSSQAVVREVMVTSQIDPDPMVCAVNDVVIWTFKGLRQNDVKLIDSVDQLVLDTRASQGSVAPRRCMNRSMLETGVFHFTSKSFNKQNKKETATKTMSGENRLSSLIVDELNDSLVIRVDSSGFHPKKVHIRKNQSILWTWKESEEAHNIIHVNPPEHEAPLSEVEGSLSFNSGKPVPKNSFLYTFDEVGVFGVASQGSPGYAGVIFVLTDPPKTPTPYITSEEKSGTVDKNTVIHLDCDSEDFTIYYSLDGSLPELHRPSVKIYKSEKGIVLNKSGLCFIRAMAVSDMSENSDVMTSSRYWVLSNDTQSIHSDEEKEELPQQDPALQLRWFSCVPTIRGLFTGPGSMEIFWEFPPENALELIKGYQVTFNGISYCNMFPPTHNSVFVAGLAGGRSYETELQVLSHDPMFLPHKSNKLLMKCPASTETGGPVISLEVTEEPDALSIVWNSVSTDAQPISGYVLYLNGQQCGSKVLPDEESNRCKVVIEGCELEVAYKFIVMAIPAGSGKPKMSNDLEVVLPLETCEIVLPPVESRTGSVDLYCEYIEVSEGAGMMADMDQGECFGQDKDTMLNAACTSLNAKFGTTSLKRNRHQYFHTSNTRASKMSDAGKTSIDPLVVDTSPKDHADIPDTTTSEGDGHIGHDDLQKPAHLTEEGHNNKESVLRKGSIEDMLLVPIKSENVASAHDSNAAAADTVDQSDTVQQTNHTNGKDAYIGNSDAKSTDSLNITSKKTKSFSESTKGNDSGYTTANCDEEIATILKHSDDDPQHSTVTNSNTCKDMHDNDENASKPITKDGFTDDPFPIDDPYNQDLHVIHEQQQGYGQQPFESQPQFEPAPYPQQGYLDQQGYPVDPQQYQSQHPLVSGQQQQQQAGNYQQFYPPQQQLLPQQQQQQMLQQHQQLLQQQNYQQPYRQQQYQQQLIPMKDDHLQRSNKPRFRILQVNPPTKNSIHKTQKQKMEGHGGPFNRNSFIKKINSASSFMSALQKQNEQPKTQVVKKRGFARQLSVTGKVNTFAPPQQDTAHGFAQQGAMRFNIKLAQAQTQAPPVGMPPSQEHITQPLSPHKTPNTGGHRMEGNLTLMHPSLSHPIRNQMESQTSLTSSMHGQPPQGQIVGQNQFQGQMNIQAQTQIQLEQQAFLSNADFQSQSVGGQYPPGGQFQSYPSPQQVSIQHSAGQLFGTQQLKSRGIMGRRPRPFVGSSMPQHQMGSQNMHQPMGGQPSPRDMAEPISSQPSPRVMNVNMRQIPSTATGHAMPPGEQHENKDQGIATKSVVKFNFSKMQAANLGIVLPPKTPKITVQPKKKRVFSFKKVAMKILTYLRMQSALSSMKRPDAKPKVINWQLIRSITTLKKVQHKEVAPQKSRFSFKQVARMIQQYISVVKIFRKSKGNQKDEKDEAIVINWKKLRSIQEVQSMGRQKNKYQDMIDMLQKSPNQFGANSPRPVHQKAYNMAAIRSPEADMAVIMSSAADTVAIKSAEANRTAIRLPAANMGFLNIANLKGSLNRNRGFRSNQQQCFPPPVPMFQSPSIPSQQEFQNVSGIMVPRPSFHRQNAMGRVRQLAMAQAGFKSFPASRVLVEDPTSFMVQDRDGSTDQGKHIQGGSTILADSTEHGSHVGQAEVSVQSQASSEEEGSENEEYMLIDGTKGPWETGRMKKAVNKNIIVNRMQASKKPPSGRKVRKSRQQDDGGPTHVEVEIHEEPEKSKRKRHKSRKKLYTETGTIVEVEDCADIGLEHQTEAPVPQQELPVRAAAFVNGPMQQGEVDYGNVLPAPVISVEHNEDGEMIRWRLPSEPDRDYNLLVFIVNVVGMRFENHVNSDLSFECLQSDGPTPVPAIQHCWNIMDDNQCYVKGLSPGTTYRIYVVANYSLVTGEVPSEVHSSSAIMFYTTIGKPAPPVVKATSADLYQVSIEWESGKCHEDIEVVGFDILVDGDKVGETLSAIVRHTNIDNLKPGKTVKVTVKTITKHPVGDSDESEPIKITCPKRPIAPLIHLQPSYKKGSVLIAWEKVLLRKIPSPKEEVLFYCVYIDGVWHAEIRANQLSDKEGYQYCLTDLEAGQSYDVNVRSFAGQQKCDASTRHYHCLCESELSNTVPVMCAAPPLSPAIQIEGMSAEGIDITWATPQQLGEAVLSGFQLFKNGKLYGSLIPSEVSSLRITDVSLGDKVTLQMIALTEHPVGRYAEKTTGNDGDSGIDGTFGQHEDVPLTEKYSACKPGPKLIFHFTGLVQPPTKVWCEQVTGHSAMLVWSSAEKPRSHYIVPDSYQVTWWPGQQPIDNINSQTATDDHLQITGLDTNTVYTVVVEARKRQKYANIQEDRTFDEDDSNPQTFILTAKSEHITVRTAQPPDPPSNLGVVATTCHGLKVAWDPPREHGVEVVAVRVDAITRCPTQKSENVYVELLPDKTSAILENLKEATEYDVVVYAITEEFFDNLSEHQAKIFKNRTLPRDSKLIPRDSIWLPHCSMIAMTSGTVPPCELKVIETKPTSLVIGWKRPVVHGSNKLLGGIIRWSEIKNTDQDEEFLEVACHKDVLATAKQAEITGLTTGAHYKIMLEAIVSIRTVIVASIEEDEQNRRTAHIMSQPILARTRAPIEPARVYISGYTASTVNLFWEKPLLYSVVGLDEDDQPKYVKRCLEGYRLEINGKPHMMVGSAAQSCTLTKCKPGRTYSIVLVALTCTESVKRERRRKLRGTIESASSASSRSSEGQTPPTEDDDNDESPSGPLEIMLPRIQHGNIESVTTKYNHETRGACDFGDIDLEWTVQESFANVKHFSAIWVCLAEGIVHRKCVDPDTRRCTIPVSKNKCVYEVSIEPQFSSGDSLAVHTQCVNVMIPGSPDPPELFTRSVCCDEFVIEWGEPKLYGGVKVKGYQVYMNDRKVGNLLSSSHRKAIIPARPNRHYKINLVATSASPNFGDSSQSNSLVISTPPRKEALLGEQSLNMNFEDFVDLDGDKEIPLRIVKSSDTSIQLDWSTYLLPEGVAYYKVQWSSVAQPAQKELRLSRDETGCVLQKLYPGTNHFVKLVAMANSGHILERSKQCTVKTSAPPDTPIVSVRAINFKYIAIQWEQPKMYGEALITGYKVYINGIVETTVSAEQFTYSYTNGKSCQEYGFQVQALTTVERLYGKPSEPLMVTWPGIKAPFIQRMPTISASSIKVIWDMPYCTDGVKIKQYKLYCKDPTGEHTVQCISPIHPDSQEAELHNMRSGRYMVYLEIHLHGTNEITRTEPIFVEPSVMPDPPQLTVTVVGLEERRQLEKVTCELLNKRDRLLRTIHDNSGMASGISPRVLIKSDSAELSIRASESLVKVDEMLDDCFASLSHYTGHLLAHVSWQNNQTDPDINISGFKILIDGKQYGTSVHSGVRNVRIKLGLDKPSHIVSMVSMSDQPRVSSASSNEVELLTQPFFPFTFYCFPSTHIKHASWPNNGCCRYEDSIVFERTQPIKQPITQGLLKRHIPPPSCKLLDVFDGDYKPLLPPGGPAKPTVLMFWTKWCLASLKLMSWFAKFAKMYETQYEFIAIACGINMTDSDERQDLIHTISENGWIDDTCLRHSTNIQATPVAMATQNVRQNVLGKPPPQIEASLDSGDITDVLGVYGVPTILIIHPQDYIAWQGRYAAHDYATFQAFLQHTLTKVMEEPCPTNNCDVCRQEQMDEANLAKWRTSHRKPTQESGLKSGYAATSSLIIPNLQFSGKSAQTVDSESMASSRPSSAGMMFMKSNKGKDVNRINVNVRPFSATERDEADSPKHERTRPRSGRRSRRKICQS